MANSKRPRACDQCHSIKIKCELGSTGGTGPCERCVRLGKDCFITPPKSQKDRVAELEAQVAALSKLLEDQKIESPSLDTASPNTNGIPAYRNDSLKLSTPDTTTAGNGLVQKKRRLDEILSTSDASVTQQTAFSLRNLDSLVTEDLQMRLLEKYRDEVVPLCPLIPLAEEWTYDSLRRRKPILFQSIVYAISSGVLSEPLQEKLGAVVLDTFAALIVQKDKWSVELVQAMQVAVLWYRAPKGYRQIAAFQLAQQAVDIAEEIGLWGSQKSLFVGPGKSEGPVDNAEILRTYLVCHLMSANLTVLTRKPSLSNLSEFDDFTLHMLNYLEEGLNVDRLLCHFVRGEKLCERIASEMGYHGSYRCDDLSSPLVQTKMQALENSITDWKTQMPTAPVSSTLSFYEHFATLYLHEAALHTAANTQSFAAPFLAERLSVTDFPTPIVTPQHVASIYAIKAAAQAILDKSATFDIQTWLALPFLPFIGRVAYAEYILVKLYTAATAAGNTYGAFLDPESLQIEMYLNQLIDTANAVREVDSSCPAARILLAPTRLKEWYQKYKASTLAHDFSFTDSDYYSLGSTPIMGDPDFMNWNDSTLNSESLDFNFDDVPDTSIEPSLFTASSLNGVT